MSDLVRIDNPNVAYLGEDRYWADNGLIHTENIHTGAYKSLSVKTALERMRGVQDMINNSRKDRNNTAYKQHIEGAQAFLEKMINIVRRAQEQGTIDDPTAVRDREIRRKKQVAITATPFF